LQRVQLQLALHTSSRQALTSGASGSNGNAGIITADRHAANVAIIRSYCLILRPELLTGQSLFQEMVQILILQLSLMLNTQLLKQHQKNCSCTSAPATQPTFSEVVQDPAAQHQAEW
jgi:hypothetical protein